MLEGFKNFIMKGNVVDLAVAVVVGSAFNSVVNAMVKDLVTPLIGAFGGEPNFSALHFTINKSQFAIGDFLNSVISFLTIAAVVYFAVVLPMNKIMDKVKGGKPADPTDKICPECLSQIPIKAKKCKYCTSVVG